MPTAIFIIYFNSMFGNLGNENFLEMNLYMGHAIHDTFSCLIIKACMTETAVLMLRYAAVREKSKSNGI